MNEHIQNPGEVFISYHTNSSSDFVKRICAALEDSGISCWYAPRNVGANYAQSIVEAIRACKVFLLVLNKESNISAHVLNEINCAFDRFRNNEDITLLPFRIDSCDLSDDVYYYLGRIHIMDGALPPEVERIQELVDRVSVILGKESKRTTTLPINDDSVLQPAQFPSAYREKTYHLTGSIVYPDSCFIGREKELEKIHQNLSGVENKMFLVGMGGIGKSEIARMYIKQHQNDYDVVLWVSFAGNIEQTLINDYSVPIQGLSRIDFPEYTDREYFQHKLRVLKEISDRRILIVIDNYDVTDAPLIEEFCSGAYTVLFTTRYHQENRNIPEVEVSEMTNEDELLKLFRTEYTRELDNTSLCHVKDIIQQLNGHTLSIRLVASTMQHRRIPPEKMACLLKGGIFRMTNENARAADMVFGRLKEVFRLSTLSEDEQYLLKNLALIPLSGISVETLFEWCGAEDFDIIDELIKKCWVIHNPATDEVHLHPLISEMFKEKLADDSECCNHLLSSLLKASLQINNHSYKQKLQLVEIISNASEKLPNSHPMRWQILQAEAQANMDMCLFEQAADIYEEMKMMAHSLNDKLYIFNTLAHFEYLSGNPDKSREYALEGYSLVEDMPLETLSMEQGHLYNELLHRLIASNRDIKDYDAAIYYGRKAVALEGRFYNVLNSSKEKAWGWSEHYLGRALYMSGDLQESKDRINHAIELLEECGNEYAASFSYDILGQIQMKLGNYTKALELNQKALDILLPRVGQEHRDIANSLEWRGHIFLAMGNKEKAIECYSQSAAIYHRLNLLRKENGVLLELHAIKA